MTARLTDPADLLLRMTPLIMISALLVRIIIMAGQQRRRRKLEAPRLASMLAVELQSLRDHYDDNLAMLARDGAVLLSLRAPGAVFRGNVGRLAGTLNAPILAPLTAVYAHHDRIEALQQASQRPMVGRRMAGPVEAAYSQTLATRLLAGRQLAEAALAAITASWPLLTAAGAGPALLEAPEEDDDALVA